MHRTVTVKEPLTGATPSAGHQQPMVRHIVDRGDVSKGIPSAATVEALKLHGVTGAVEPQAKTLCGEPWDRLGITPNGPLCDACRDVYRQRHPGWPLPGHVM